MSDEVVGKVCCEVSRVLFYVVFFVNGLVILRFIPPSLLTVALRYFFFRKILETL